MMIAMIPITKYVNISLVFVLLVGVLLVAVGDTTVGAGPTDSVVAAAEEPYESSPAKDAMIV